MQGEGDVALSMTGTGVVVCKDRSSQQKFDTVASSRAKMMIASKFGGSPLQYVPLSCPAREARLAHSVDSRVPTFRTQDMCAGMVPLSPEAAAMRVLRCDTLKGTYVERPAAIVNVSTSRTLPMPRPTYNIVIAISRSV